MFLQRGQSGTAFGKYSPKRDFSEKLTNMRTLRVCALGVWIGSFALCVIPEGDRGEAIAAQAGPVSDTPRQRAQSWVGASFSTLLSNWPPPLQVQNPAPNGRFVAYWDMGNDTVIMVPRGSAAQIQAQTPAPVHEAMPSPTSTEPYTPIIGDGWGGRDHQRSAPFHRRLPVFSTPTPMTLSTKERHERLSCGRLRSRFRSRCIVLAMWSSARTLRVSSITSASTESVAMINRPSS